MPQDSVQHIKVPRTHIGQRIDNYLIGLLKDIPKSHIYRILRSGEIRVNSRRVKPTYRLIAGDEVRIPPLTRRNQSGLQSIPKEVRDELESAVLYEDDNVMIFNKPSGLAVHSGSRAAYGLIDVVRAMRPSWEDLQLVHRLDKDASGCLLIAKIRPALVQLHRLLRSHEFGKYYQALVFGRWQHGFIEVSMPLSKTPIAPQHDRVVANAQGKLATTRFKPVQIFNQCTLMEIQIETGRTHQIRAHAAYLGHALAGDRKYGNFAFNRHMRTLGLKRLFLHASRVVFELSDTKAYDVSAPLDDQLSNVLERLTSTDAEFDRI